jgi:hypothetical protein
VSQAAAPSISPNGGSFSSAQTLTVSDSTPGAVYHCTTDSSTPSASSAACPSTITVSPSSATVVVKVYVSASGYTDSATSTATFTYVAPPQATAPTINPATGTYTAAQTLTVTGATGTTVHCTLDGSTPTASSAPCPSTNLSSNGTTTVKAYATESGYTDSGVASAVITINIPQAAAPSISPNGGSFSSAQTLTVSDSTPGAVYHCTTDSSTPTSASGSCPSTVNLSSTLTTVTVKVYASASGYTDSSIATATFNYVAQSVAWTGAINVDLNGTLAITSSNLTASSSCPPASVAFTVVPVSTDTAHASGSTFASWAADTTNATYGNILGGNALLEDNTNTFTATATCGSSVSKTTLTVNDVAPVLTSISPTTVKSSSTSTTFDLIGTGFSAQSSTQNLTQWFGTLALGHSGGCPTTHNKPGGGTAWISPTHIQQFLSGNVNTGTYSYVVYNAPTAAGTGGGWACLANAFTVTANAITGTGNAMVIVDPGTSTGASPSTAGTAATGTATVVKNGAVTKLALAANSGNPVAQGNLVFVPNQAAHTISQIDTDAATPTVSTIPTGAEYAPAIVAADANNVLVAATATATSDANSTATANGDPSQGAILTLRNGYLTKLADAPYFDDLAIQGQNVLWISTPKGSTTAQVHMIALTGGPEKVVQLTQHADSLKVMADGTLLAYHVGDTKALVLDPFTLLTRGSVSFTKGLYGFSGDYATLADGSIGKVAVSQDGAGNPTVNFTAIDTAEGNYGSFAVDTTTQPGVAKVYSVYHDGSGTSAPRVHVVPQAQAQ